MRKDIDRHPSPPIWLLPVLALIILGVIAALTGCAPPPSTKATAQINSPRMEYNVPGINTVVEFRLIDGTRCVSVYQGGLTCEWKQPVVLLPRVE